MLEISLTKIAHVILMSRELDRAERELRAFIDRLNEEEQTSLVALMWIGRGAFEPEELAEAIHRLALDADLRRRLGQAGRETVCRHHGIDAFIQAHERVYEDVARRAPRKTRPGRPAPSVARGKG